MASASSTSAKNLFVDSKTRLAERVQVNINNMGSICRQVNRGSQSADMLTHSARNMALQEHALKNAEDNLQKLNLLITHLGYQHDSIQRSAYALENVKEQVRDMQR
ncbi:BLOC-1-related complex subunit 7-like [Penaeus monodon]|uniref:BLOC-1-related complex subunit 7-like n=1 Tax=Penaeus monodon TaxID=6687 RepID=UPI0018A7B227|nr:BLOC-1-related complex subunit 7-like [Penaeus monodon]